MKASRRDRDDVDGVVESTELVTVKFTLTGGDIPKFVPGGPGSPFTFGVDEVAESVTPEPVAHGYCLPLELLPWRS